MPPSGSTLLGQLLNAFIFTLSGGYARSVEGVLSLLVTLATVELTVAAIAWAFTRQQWIASLFWKLLGFAFLAWIIDAWPTLTQGLMDGFIEAGLTVGGGTLSVTDFRDPGNLIDYGFSVTAILTKNLTKMNVLTSFFTQVMGGLAILLIILCYTVLAASVFKAVLEYYVASACLLFMVPFLAHEKTAPFGERVFGTFMAHALRLLIYAAILSCALPVLYTYKLPTEAGVAEGFMLFAASFVLVCISLSAPAMAMGLIQGTPVLDFRSILHGATSMAQTASAVGAVGAAVSLAGAGALRSAISAGSAIRAAAQLGAAQYQANNPASSSRASSLRGGAEGVGTYAAHRLTSGFRAAIQEGRARAAASRSPQP